MAVSQDIIKQIKRYYLFYGLNEYRLDQRVASLIKALISPGSEAFDIDRLDGRRVDMSSVINAVSTPPVLNPLRVVVLRDIDKLSSNSQNQLESLLPKIPQYSVLAMTAAKPDKRSRLMKKLLAEDKVHSFNYEEYKSDEAAAVVIKFARDRGKEIGADVAGIIVDIFGVEPYRLENEVEKLSLYVGDKNRIEKKDLAFASGFNRVETVYDLPDLILKGQHGQALELARRALASGISEMQMLYILKNYLLALNAARSLGDIKKIMSVLGTNIYRAREYSSKAKGTSQDGILKGLTLIFRAEYALKSARFPSEIIIELLIMALYLALRGNIKESRLY